MIRLLPKLFSGVTFKQTVAFACVAVFAVSTYSNPLNELSFNIAPRHQLGLNAMDRAYSDLDGDGNLDIAVVNGGQGNPNPTITILFGTAEGSFESTLAFPSYMIGHTIALGDLNHDGRPEIVAASWYQNKIAVYFNQGNRQFSLPTISAPPDPPNPGFPYGEFFDLAIADFDGDGNNDVVALQDQIDQRLRFFHFNADGSFTVFTTIFQLETGTSYERVIAVGDLNGDARMDVVFAGGGPFGVRNVSFVYGQAVGGTLSITYGFEVDDQTVGVSIKDLDNDGDCDLAIAYLNWNRHSLQIFRNNGSSDFEARPKIFLEYPFPPYDITTNDFDNDGVQDIAVLVGTTYREGVMVLVTNGTGDCTFSGDKYYVVSGSTSIFSADLNRDKKIDLITASPSGLQSDYSAYVGVSTSSVSVLLNDSSRRFKAPLVSLLWAPNFIDSGDFNNDGYRDFASAWATSFSELSGVDIAINDRHGGFFDEVRVVSPAALRDMKVGDFNGDGNPDAITAHWWDNTRQLAVYFGDGNGTLAFPVVMSISQTVTKILAADFNRDGKDDILVMDGSDAYCMLGVGNGTFVPVSHSPMPFAAYGGNILARDVNRDQIPDLIMSSAGTRVWIGDGNGRFSQAPGTIPALTNVAAADFNGDGKLDLAGTTAPVGTLPPWRTDIAITGVLGDGNGGFSGSFSRNIPDFLNRRTSNSIVAADFDLDGFDDVALVEFENIFGSLIFVRSGGATPSWETPTFPAVGTATLTLLAEDFNSDGATDIGWLGENARGVIYNTILNTREADSPFDFDGDGTTDVSIFRPAPAEWWYLKSSNGGNYAAQFGATSDKIAAADFTGDGKSDIAFFRPSTGQWFVLRSEDSSFFAFPFGSNGDIPVPADYDGDGKADAAVFRPSNVTWFVSKSTGGTLIQQFGATTDAPVPSDYDGDGKADLAIYRANGANQEWWYQRSSNSTVYAAAFGTTGDRAVPGDYTGDGKSDIAFFRPSTGNWFVLRSEDSSFYAFPFGASGDVPAPGDYDGDGKFDAAVFRAASATWFLNRSTAGVRILNFGAATDLPIPNAYVR